MIEDRRTDMQKGVKSNKLANMGINLFYKIVVMT